METGYIYKHDTKLVGFIIQSCTRDIIDALYKQYISDKNDKILTYKSEDFLIFQSCTYIFKATRIDGEIKVKLNGRTVQIEKYTTNLPTPACPTAGRTTKPNQQPQKPTAMNAIYTARFQYWENGERQYNSNIITDPEELWLDKKCASESFATTIYKEFKTLPEAQVWIAEMFKKY